MTWKVGQRWGVGQPMPGGGAAPRSLRLAVQVQQDAVLG